MGNILYENGQPIYAIVDGKMVDVQKVKHGRWEWEGFNIACSECGFMPYFDSTEPLYHYCPNCGAKMDEVEE